MEQTKAQTLKEVHTAIEDIEEARATDIPVAEKLKLERISVKLFHLEQSIIRAISADLVKKLTEDTLPLEQLVKEIDSSIASLEKVVKSVGKTVEVVNVLVKIAAIGGKIL